jgi:hypothetical protein
MKTEKLFYIQNTNAGYMGNAIVFWAKGRNGYTCNLDNSQKFTEEEACKICKDNPVKNKAWPVDYIDSNEGIQRIVDSQYLRSTNIKDFKRLTPRKEQK